MKWQQLSIYPDKLAIYGKSAAEAKTRSNWRSVMTQIATEYVADPHKYGDGSGYGGRGACVDRFGRP